MVSWLVFPASQGPAGSWNDIAIWSGILLGLLLIGVVIGARVRRLAQPGEEDSPDGFTLHGLRQLHARGELDDDEFERAKAALIDRIRREPTKESDLERPDKTQTPQDAIDKSDDDGESDGENDETALP